MCGIAGLYAWPVPADVEQLSSLIAHRGPDGSGVYVDDTRRLQLAHRRLAIIDLSEAGAQPFIKDGLVLIYNGELYNYRALRQELEAAGVRFRSQSDTEVVLEGWRRWGAGALGRFRGMWAFAIYDQRTGELVLARDHFGIKPVFLYERGGGLAFASELKALIPVIEDMQICDEALVASLLYYWVPEAHCIVKGVHKLPAGSWASFRPGSRLVISRWFSPVDELADHQPLSSSELHEVVAESVRAHLVADVPISSFLSGGLDSSYVVAIAKQLKSNVDAYTISFREEDQRLEAMPDDLHYAKIVARRFGVDLHEIRIAPDVVILLPQMAYTLDEPIGDPAAINTTLICQAACDTGVKVLLSGMGADELFGGYRKHYACLLAARYRRLPKVVRFGVLKPLIGRLPVAVGNRGLRSLRWAKRFVSFASLPEEAAFRRSYTLYGYEELDGLLSPELLPAVDRVLAEHAEIYNHTGFDEPVNRMCMTDLQMFLVGLNLTYTDRASMAASCEVRVPFVDIEVAKAAFRLSGHQKIRGRERKAALKEAARAVLPQEIVCRPKGLFSAPLRAWVRRDLAEMIDDALPHGELVKRGLLRRAGIEEVIRTDRDGIEDRSKELWHLLTMEEWLRQFSRSVTTATPRSE